MGKCCCLRRIKKANESGPKTLSKRTGLDAAPGKSLESKTVSKGCKTGSPEIEDLDGRETELDEKDFQDLAARLSFRVSDSEDLEEDDEDEDINSDTSCAFSCTEGEVDNDSDADKQIPAAMETSCTEGPPKKKMCARCSEPTPDVRMATSTVVEPDPNSCMDMQTRHSEPLRESRPPNRGGRFAARIQAGNAVKSFAPNCYAMSPKFLVDKKNNWRIIADIFRARGWRHVVCRPGSDPEFDLKWVNSNSTKVNFEKLVPGQFVNRIQNHEAITSKMQLLHNIRRYEDETGYVFGYHPVTYLSILARDKQRALDDAKASPEAVWILKPSRGHGGTGIQIVKGVHELCDKIFPPGCTRDDDADIESARAAEGCVIQRYIEKPLLLRGRKFDIRTYCLVARTDPHLWFFHPGYSRVALRKYVRNDLGDRHSHLTNACVQKTHPSFRKLRGQHIWSEAQVEAELVASGRWSKSFGTFWRKIYDQMMLCLVDIFKVSRDSIKRKRGSFHLLGLDFMLDEDCRVYLLELNSNPALSFEYSPTLKTMFPSLISSTVDIVLQSQHRATGLREPSATGAFKLIVNEAGGYLYGDEIPEQTVSATRKIH